MKTTAIPEMFDKSRYFLGSMQPIYDMIAFTPLTKEIGSNKLISYRM